MKRGNPKFSRRKAQRSLKYVLIVCLGEQTEKNYFEAFPTGDAVRLQVAARSETPSKLVEKAQGIIDQNKKDYSEVWIVFDRDDFQKGKHQDVAKAYRAAKESGFNIAYSVSCFEFWVLLHFEEGENFTGYKSEDYCKYLKQGPLSDYDKKMPDIYDRLKGSQADAIERAKVLCPKHFMPLSQPDPSTSIWKLVERLNQFVDANNQKKKTH